MRTALSENHYCGPNCSFLLAPVVQKVDNAIHLDKSLSTILVKTFGTRCVSGEESVLEWNVAGLVVKNNKIRICTFLLRAKRNKYK